MNKICSHLLPCLFLTLIGIVFYLVWRSNSPYPNALNWDLWEHQTIINTIKSGSFAIFPSQLSDTFQFDGYTTVFHGILAGIQNLGNISNVLGFWWVSEGIFFIITSLALYTFCFTVTKNRWVATLAGIISIGFFESSMAYTTLFLLPQTVAAVIWLIGMTILTRQKTIRVRLITTIVISFAIISFHAIVGAFGAGLLFLYAIGLTYLPASNGWLTLLSLLGFLIAYVIPTTLTQLFPVGTINSGEAQFFTQPVSQKLALFRQWYGFLPIPFIILGILKASVSKNIAQRALIIGTAICLGCILSPFPYVLKFTVIARSLLIGLMAVGFVWFIEHLPSTVTRITLLLVTIATVALIFYANTTQWKQPVLFRDIATHVSHDERIAADTLGQRYAQTNTLLVSDPATQYIIETLSGINSQGGAYMNIATRDTIIHAFSETNEKNFKNSLNQVQDTRLPYHPQTILLVLSARSITWLGAFPENQRNISYNIWRPNALSVSDELKINEWKVRYGLNEVYRNTNLVAFEITL